MTHSQSSDPHPRPTLKVVAPVTPPPVAPPEPTEPEKQVSPQATTTFPRRAAIGSMVALSLLGAAFIPVNLEVGGEITLEPKPSKIQRVMVSRSAFIESVNPDIQPGKPIKKGQVLAKLRSHDLERELLNVNHLLGEARQKLETQQRVQAEAQANADISEAEVEVAQQQQIQAEQLQSKPSKVQEIESQIAGLQQDRGREQGRLVDYQKLVREGGWPREKLEDQQMVVNRINSKIETLYREVETIQQDQVNRIEGAEITRLQRGRVALARQQLAEAHTQTAAVQSTINDLEVRRKQLELDQQKELELVAAMDGVVSEQGFFLQKGNVVQPDKPIVQIINLQDLIGTIKIPEQDRQEVKEGMQVYFRLAHDKLHRANATVDRISPDIIASPGQGRTFSVVISVSNTDRQLYAGSSGYARITSRQVALYERVWQEVKRLLRLEMV